MLVNIDDLKLYLSITNTWSGGDLTVWNESDWDLAYNDTSQDWILQILLDWAISFVQHYCGRTFWAVENIELVNWNAQNQLILKKFPVVEITAFDYNEWTKSVPVWTAIDEDTYWTNEGSWVINLSFLLNRWFQNYRVTYESWYETDPPDLKVAVLKLAANYYTVRWADWIKSESVSWDRIEYWMQDIPSDVLLILNSYKNVNVV